MAFEFSGEDETSCSRRLANRGPCKRSGVEIAYAALGSESSPRSRSLHSRGKRELRMDANALSGCIPEAVSEMTLVVKLWIERNRLSGCFPGAAAAMTSIKSLVASENQLQGAIPDAVGSLQVLGTLKVGRNGMSGSIPWACGRSSLTFLSLYNNAFSGPALIDHWIKPGAMLIFDASRNRLTGSLPEGAWHMKTAFFGVLDLSENQLTGTLADLEIGATWTQIILDNNRFEGTLPLGFTVSRSIGIQNNKLFGSLPTDAISDSTMELICSGNRLEGTLPQLHHRSPGVSLRFLDVSGMIGSASHLQGPLPGTLARAGRLSLLLAHSQEFQGDIPGLSGTLNLLVLHRNRLKSLPGRLLLSDKKGYYSIILLHQNLLSCDVPRFNRFGATLSLAALGNHLWHPAVGAFPTWVSPLEKEGLFWVSKTEGRMFGLKAIIAMTLFGCAVRTQFNSKLVREAVSKWRSAVGPHGVFAKAVCCQLSQMLGVALWAMAFLAILLSWDLYHCPRSFALASACLRENVCVPVIGVLTWATHLLRLRMGRNGIPHGKRFKIGEQSCNRMWHKRMQLIVWIPLTLSLSAFAVVDQMNRSVPDIFQVGASATHVISMGIGSAQGLMLGSLVPWLIDRLAPGMQALQGFLGLVTSCLIPALVIVYLDGACLEQWVVFWKPCSPKHRAQFAYSFTCPKHPWCPDRATFGPSDRDVVVLTSGDLCRPQRQSSISRCTTLALLRLQDVWLSKWIVTGLLAPAGQMIFDNPAIDPLRVSSQINYILEFAILVSGPLPALMPVLLIAMFSKIVLMAASWVKGNLLRARNGSMAGTTTGLAEILSIILHLSFAYGNLSASSTAAMCSLLYFWKTSGTC